MTCDALSVTVLTVGAMVTSIGWKLSLLALMPLPILAAAALFFGKFVFIRSRAVQDAFGRLSDVSQENISGMRVVKAFCQEESEERKFDEANRNYLARFMSMVRVQGLIDPTIQMLAGACFVLALIFPGQAVLRGQIPLGSFVSLTLYINMLIWPMLATGWVVNIIQRGLAGYDRLQSVLTVEPDVATSAHPVQPQGGIQGDIEIRDLTFTYTDKKRPALKDLSVRVHPGQTLGIIGRTGSGKSTLVSLLARVFNPPRGTIFVDGDDVLDLPLDLLREHIAFVPQEAFLSPGRWARISVSLPATGRRRRSPALPRLPRWSRTFWSSCPRAMRRWLASAASSSPAASGSGSASAGPC
jgi:ATP-binding cassette subfamily B protein